MANYQFDKDIIIGESGEETVRKDLESMGAKFIGDNKDNKYDLIIEKNNKEISYEIKTDVFCSPIRDTGNIFVEYECRGKKSGILVSKADWFVTYYKNLNEIWYIKTDKLKELINNNPMKVVTFAGDANSNTKGVLVPRNKYKEQFIIRNART